MLKHSSAASAADRDRLDLLMLQIEPDAVTQKEITTLQSRCKQSTVAFDDNDPDPDSIAARQHMMAHDLFKEEQRRSQRSNALAERYYAKRGKEMNSWRVS